MNAGIYPTHAAVMILGTELVQLGASGVIDTLGYRMDAEGVVHAVFTENRTAAISWSHLVGTPEETSIFGSKGTIHLHPPAHAPTTLTVSKLKTTRRAPDTFSVTHEFPLPAVQGNFFYPNSEGLYYEAAAVQRCVLAGLTECPQLPLEESVLALQMVKQAVDEISKPHRSKKVA